MKCRTDSLSSQVSVRRARYVWQLGRDAEGQRRYYHGDAGRRDAGRPSCGGERSTANERLEGTYSNDGDRPARFQAYAER